MSVAMGYAYIGWTDDVNGGNAIGNAIRKHEGSEDSWVTGAIMNVTGSVFINLGTNLMKLGHLRSLKRKRRVAIQDALLPRITEEEAGPDDITVYRCCQDSWTWTPSVNRCRFRKALLSKTWVMGFTTFFLGNALNFLSFSYAAQSLLASLGSVQFITNVIFARVVLKEELTWRVLMGTAVLICGVALVVRYSCHGNPAVEYSLNELIGLFIDEPFLIYLASLFCLWVILQCYLRSVAQKEPDPSKHGSKLEAISYAAASAIIGAQAVTFFKIVSELITIVTSVEPNDDVTKRAVYQSPFSYCVLFAAIFSSLFWIQRLNNALRLYDVLFIIPVFQVMWVTLSVVGGGIFFHEFEQCFQGFTAFMFVLGLLIIFLGVFLLSPQTLEMPPEHEALLGTDTLQSPLLRNNSMLASGGGLGMTLPTPHMSQAIIVRSTVSPFSSGSSSPSLPIERGALQRSGSSFNFGLAIFPVVDAVEARDQRTSSSNLIADQRSRSGSGRAVSAPGGN